VNCRRYPKKDELNEVSFVNIQIVAEKRPRGTDAAAFPGAQAMSAWNWFLAAGFQF